MGHLSADERRTVRAAAHQFVNSHHYVNTPEVLYAALMDRADLDILAFQGPAERYIAIQEAWSREIGAIFAETVRRAFRDAEHAKREQMQAALIRQRAECGEEDAGDGPEAAR